MLSSRLPRRLLTATTAALTLLSVAAVIAPEAQAQASTVAVTITSPASADTAPATSTLNSGDDISVSATFSDSDSTYLGTYACAVTATSAATGQTTTVPGTVTYDDPLDGTCDGTIPGGNVPFAGSYDLTVQVGQAVEADGITPAYTVDPDTGAYTWDASVVPGQDSLTAAVTGDPSTITPGTLLASGSYVANSPLTMTLPFTDSEPLANSGYLCQVSAHDVVDTSAAPITATGTVTSSTCTATITPPWSSDYSIKVTVGHQHVYSGDSLISSTTGTWTPASDTTNNPSGYVPASASGLVAVSGSSGVITTSISSPAQDSGAVDQGTDIPVTATFTDTHRLTHGSDYTCIVSDNASHYWTGSVAPNASGGVCTATVNEPWGGSYALTVAVGHTYVHQGTVTYDVSTHSWGSYTPGTATVPVTIDGQLPPINLCDGTASAPASCRYHWVESWIDGANNSHTSVCALDNNCWMHEDYTSWPLSNGWWTNNNAPDLTTNGNVIESTTCIGAKQSAWLAYTGNYSTISSSGYYSTAVQADTSSPCDSEAVTDNAAPAPVTPAPPTPETWTVALTVPADASISSGSDYTPTVNAELSYGVPLAGAPMTLQQSVASGDWQTIGTYTTDADGNASAPAQTVTWRTRYQWIYDGGYADDSGNTPDTVDTSVDHPVVDTTSTAQKVNTTPKVDVSVTDSNTVEVTLSPSADAVPVAVLVDGATRANGTTNSGEVSLNVPLAAGKHTFSALTGRTSAIDAGASATITALISPYVTIAVTKTSTTAISNLHLSGQPLQLLVDGHLKANALTDGNGKATFKYAALTGAHSVSVEFADPGTVPNSYTVVDGNAAATNVVFTNPHHLIPASRVKITGKATVHHTLRASFGGSWRTDTAKGAVVHGVQIHYQWFIDGKPLKGGTKTTLKLAHAGWRKHKITVRVTAVKTGWIGYTAKSKTVKVK